MEPRLQTVALPERNDDTPEPGSALHTISQRRNKAKVLIVMFFAVVFGAFGDIALSRGMKMVDAADPPGIIAGFLMTMTNPFVMGGIVLLIAFLVLYLASLSWESLSFVLPLTAADYVLVTLLAHFLLREDVSPLRWAGSVLVACGIALVART